MTMRYSHLAPAHKAAAVAKLAAALQAPAVPEPAAAIGGEAMTPVGSGFRPKTAPDPARSGTFSRVNRSQRSKSTYEINEAGGITLSPQLIVCPSFRNTASDVLPPKLPPASSPHSIKASAVHGTTTDTGPCSLCVFGTCGCSTGVYDARLSNWRKSAAFRSTSSRLM